jgi:preprotein translocase subunit SecD
MNRALAIICGLALFPSGGCSQPKVGTNLVFEVDRTHLAPEDKIDGKALAAAVDRRLARGWSRNGKAELMPDGRILVGIYGSDPNVLEYVKLILGHTGRLEFRILANVHDHADLIERGKASKDRRLVDAEPGKEPSVVARWLKARKEVAEYLPPEIMRDDGAGGHEVLVVNDSIDLTGECLHSASANTDAGGLPCVVFSFDAIGSRKMGELTTANLPEPVIGGFKRRMAIVLDGEVVTAPSINSPIYDRGEFTGSFTQAEVEQFAAILNAGPLPAPLKLVSETPAGK